MYNVSYVVCYRPESKPRQEASHLERTLHLDMVCRHRNQLIGRTKNVYCLKSINNSRVEADLDGTTFICKELLIMHSDTIRAYEPCREGMACNMVNVKCKCK